MASDDEFSDLTDLDSEDDEVPKKKGKPAAKSGWRIKNALKVPRATTYTAQALFDQIHNGDVDLEAEYQREVVWTEAKQIGVIDSIFRNFYIPPIIFAVNVYDDGSEKKTCIDGKQRLTSIQRFMDGLIPHKDPNTSEKLWYKDGPTPGRGSKSRRLLPVKYQKLFANKQVVCVEYQDITDADEREIFQRVQLGMALTPAEKLQVIKTSRADFIRELQNEYMKEEGWLGASTLEWDTSRGSDFRGLAQAVYYMEKFTPGLKSISMQQLEKWLALEAPLSTALQEKVRNAYRIFSDLIQDEKHSKLVKKTKVSPVEFISIGVMIFVHKDKASLSQLAAGISSMRDDVRALYMDIRMNNRVMNTMLEFINGWKPSKMDDSSPASQSLSAGVKRKRPLPKKSDGREDDENDEPASKAKKTPKKSTNATASSAAAATPKPVIKPESSPPIPFPHIPTDRMAALRKAKDAAAHNQALRSAQIPSGPRATLPARSDAQSAPQMLPSPGQPFTFPTSLAPALGSSGNPGTPTLQSNSQMALDSSLMALLSMTQVHAQTAAQSWPGQLPLPPPPPSGGSASSIDAASYRGEWDRDRERDRDRDRDRDRERERDRDRDRDRGHPPPYDDRDRRYDQHRRDSGGGRRSPDDSGRRATGSSRGWAPSR